MFTFIEIFWGIQIDPNNFIMTGTFFLLKCLLTFCLWKYCFKLSYTASFVKYFYIFGLAFALLAELSFSDPLFQNAFFTGNWMPQLSEQNTELWLNSSFLSLNWFYIHWINLVLGAFLIFSMWFFMNASSFRDKLLYFALCIFAVTVNGFIISFDALIMLMLVTEATVFMLILFIFLTKKFEISHKSASKKFGYLYLFFAIVILICAQDSSHKAYIYYNNVFPYVADIVAHDLLCLYLFVLEQTPMITVYISVLLGFFSIFFITFFFSLKNLKKIKPKNKKELNSLRKQIFFRQSVYKSRVRTYQNLKQKKTKQWEKKEDLNKTQTSKKKTTAKTNINLNKKPQKRNIAYKFVVKRKRVNLNVPKRQL